MKTQGKNGHEATMSSARDAKKRGNMHEWAEWIGWGAEINEQKICWDVGMRIVNYEKKKGAKVNEKQVWTRNEASNIGSQVMIRNKAASTRFNEQ